MKLPLRLLAVLSLILSALPPVRAADDVAAVITRCRAFVGSETALKSIQCVRYVGVLEATDAKGATVIKGQLDVTFQSPYRMRQVITTAKTIETTGLDDFSSWVLEQNAANPAQRRFNPRKVEAIARSRANVWENLAFYRGIEAVGGRIEDAGTVTLDGQTARKLIFRHDNQIHFSRWFDPASGRLLLTETDDGTAIREEGEIRSGGLRFPKKLVNTTKDPAGTTGKLTIIFEKITVNEPLDAGAFAPPLLGPPAAPAGDALKLPKLGTDLAPAAK